MCLTGPFKFNESDVLLGLESKRVRRLLEDGKHVTSNSVEDPHYDPYLVTRDPIGYAQ